MTEIAAEVPAQRTDSGTADAGAPEDTSVYGRITDTAGDAAEKVSEVAGKVSDVAGDVAVKVGEVAGDVAEKVSDATGRAVAASGRIAAEVVDRLRNSAELAAERGSTVIRSEVVEKIVGIATREVPGVYDLGGDTARVFAAVKERVGLGTADADQGVSVQLEGNTAEVKIVIVIEYGYVVYSVTEKVRTKVIGAVENLLGLEVLVVDIIVDDVHVTDAGPAGAAGAVAAGAAGAAAGGAAAGGASFQ